MSELPEYIQNGIDLVKDNGGCGELSPDRESICILPKGHLSRHPWGTREPDIGKAMHWLEELKTEAHTLTNLDYRLPDYQEQVAIVLSLCKPVYIDNAVRVIRTFVQPGEDENSG